MDKYFLLFKSLIFIYCLLCKVEERKGQEQERKYWNNLTYFLLPDFHVATVVSISS